MTSLQEEHLNRLRYEAATGGKRPAQPSIPAHLEVEDQPKKRGRPTVRKARAAPPTRRTSVSTSGPLCEEPVEVEAGKKKRRKGARKAQANPPARQTSTSTADAIPESTTSTGFLMLEPPPTQMPESTSVPEWTWRWGEPCSWKGRVNCLRKFKLLCTIKEQLSKVNALERFENSVFGHFLRFDKDAYHNGKVLLALFGREVNVSGAAELERWYRFGGRNNRFRKVEYCQITGLRFFASDFNPDSSDHLPSENGVYRRHFDGTTIYGDPLFEKFEEGFFNEPEEAVKVALVLFAHFFFIAADGRTTIALWLWTLVEKEELFADFPWGSYTFQRLSHYLTQAIHPLKPDKADYQPNVYAYLMPLQMWACETIPMFAEEGGMKSGDSGIPRGVRWKCPKNNWNRVHELDRDDLAITPMTLTKEEMVAPYMRAIEMKISEEVQYIHLETWISSCPPLEKCSGIVQPKGRPKKRPSKTRKCLGDPTTGEGSGERVGTAHGVGTSGDVGSRGAVGDRATDDPSPSVLESMNRAVSSAVSHALPGALREALDLTLPVLLPAIVERAIESVLPGMLSDAVRRAVDLAIPGAVEQAVELFRRHRDKAFSDVSCSRDERGYQGADPFIHEEPATQTSNEKTGGEPAGCAGSSDFLYGVHGDKEPTENFGNVGLVTPKEPRLKHLKMKSRFKLSPFVDCLDNDRRDVGINPKYFVGPEYFVEIEKARTHLSTTHINPYLTVLWRRLESGVRLRPGVSLETLNIQDSSFYGHLVKAWNTLHPPDVECAPVDYAEWDAPTILVEYVEDSLPRWGQPWTTVSNSSNTYCCERVVLVCNVEQHWVVCLLRIDAWEITLFDSLPSPDRVRQLEPLSRLIPYVIAKGGYFDAKSVAPRFDLMPVVSIPKDDELVQGDVHSCGVFACMYIERMIACDFPQSSSISDVEEYRGKIALEIFAHSDEVTS
ncbi:hypothetical protein CASFOL_009313 [Castilleja foliolosa]|uniref:Ubiquitin-like protease family profile domain-containing protein n=1 Tax=Castilleja foliolosa TaxID=1961234 RepID=A0ABD3DXZ1_9LAMI